MGRLLSAALAGLSAIVLGWLLIGAAAAASSIQNVTTASDYSTVSVAFSDETPTGTGTDGEVLPADVGVVGTTANLVDVNVSNGGLTLDLEFDAPVQPATTVITFPGGLSTGVPLTGSDWTAIQSALRAMPLPAIGDVPIASAFMSPVAAPDPGRTLDELLPVSIPTSLDIPDQFTITRNPDGSFLVGIAGGVALTSVDVSVDVDVDNSAAEIAYGVGLASTGTLALDVSLDGTIALDSAGAITGGTLRLDLDAAGSLSFTGSIGPVAATVDATAILDASFAFVAGSTDVPTATLDTAEVVVGDVTVAGFGPSGSDIVLAGPLLEFDWPTLPTTDPATGVRTETVVVTDLGWTAAGLQALANVGLGDILGGPGALASWMLGAQDLDVLATEIPLIGGQLGDTLGIAETLGTAQNEIAAAFSVAGSVFSVGDVANLSDDICGQLRANRVRAAELEKVFEDGLAPREPVLVPDANDDIDADAAYAAWEADVLAAITALPTGSIDGSAIGSAFDEVCTYLYNNVSLDLAAGTIELDIDIPDAAFEFLTAEPSLDLAFDGAGLDSLGVAVEGTWTGTASASVDLTLGVKLVSDAELLATHGLVVDLADPDPDPDTPPGDIDLPGLDEGDVTAAHRIYIPAGQIANADVSITGTGIIGTAQVGFLDLTIAGDVAITPSVTMRVVDPETGLPDGNVDLAEMLDATLIALDGSSAVSTVLEVGIAGDDVDAHFQLANNIVATTADIDIAGDITGLFPGRTIDFRPAGIAGPGDVPPDTLAIGQTFGDSLDLSALTPTEIIAMAADALDAVATNAAADAGDQRIPVIDVSLDEVAEFTSSVSDVADTLRDRAPTNITELEAFVNDALQANGMGAVTVGFTASGPSGDPELTLTLDAGVSASASFPVSFSIDDFSLAPIDAGARLDAAVAVDFTPVLGIRLTDDPIADRVFVRDVAARFDVAIDAVTEGGIAFGPLEASIDGSVSVGDSDLSTGGLTAALTRASDSSVTIPLSALTSGDVAVAVTGSLPVAGSLELSVPLLDASGTVTVAGDIPGGVTYTTDLSLPSLRMLLADFQPDLGDLVDGAIESARFMARGSAEASDLAGNVPIVGDDVGSGFADVAETLDLVADELETAVAFLEDNDNDAADYIEGKLNTLLGTLGCAPVCSADVRWVGDDPQEDLTILTASGIEILLTLEDSIDLAAPTTASFGLEPLIELDIDVSTANATIGYAASIGLGVDVETGFYLFPGIDNPTDGVGTMLEIYAKLDLAAQIDIELAGVTASADSIITLGGPLNGGTAAGLKVEMPDQVPLADIVNRRRSFSETLTPSLSADIHAELPVEFPVSLGDDLDVEFVFPLVFDWSFADTLSPSFADASFGIVDATLDISSFANPVADLLDEFDSKYNPLSIAEIRAVLNTEIPLIETTVRDALLAACELQGPTDPTCTAFKVLTNIQQLSADFRGFADNGAVELGSFQILPAPPSGTSRYTAPGAAPTLLGPPPAAPGPTPAAAVAPGVTQDLADRVTALTGGYMSLPILSDYEAIMGIILGGDLGSDVEFIRLEIPEDRPIVLGRAFNFKKTLLDLDIGFISGNLKVDLNGSIGLRISGGFGYSSRGISTGNPLDGLFIIDNGASEVSLGVSVRAAVDGRFALKAGFEIGSVQFSGAGGISAEAGLDLFDESPVLVGRGGGDGRLFLDEIAIIADAYEGPLGLPSEFCMFQLRTTGKWNLSFSGKAKVLGITVFNKSFSDSGVLWDETISCTLRTRIARVEDRQLILHAGPNAGDRFDGEGDVREQFTLTQTGGNVTVDWIPVDPRPDKASITVPASAFDTIIADMGLADDAVDVANNITQPVVGRGGPGVDTLNGGGGNDDLDGGIGGDTINGRSGNDRLRGGPGTDTITGGAGGDTVNGGAGNDWIVFADGFGNDTVADSGTAADTDTLDFGSVTTSLTGSSSFGDSVAETASSRASYLAADFETVIGGAARDVFTFKDQEPNGFSFDGSGGSDSVTFLSGRRNRVVSVSDSGAIGDDDDVKVIGTASADKFLLRASSTVPGQEASDGFVAKLGGSSGQLVDRYDYDTTIEDIVVDGGLSADTFSLDDNAARTRIVGGQGDDIVQVGQVYGLADCEPDNSAEAACLIAADPDSVRGSAVGVSGDDTFATTVITRGHLSNGVTHELVIDGGDDDDTITIFANNAVVTANGGDGNDQFVARAFILTNSVTLNGDGGIDDFNYVVNSELNINGGDGVDTFTVVGTEADDGFIIDVDVDGFPTVRVCPLDPTTGRPDESGASGGCAITALVDEVEVFAAIGLEGDDVFWIRSTVGTSLVELNGGEHSDRFLIGDGTLASINGPVAVSGDDAGEVPAMPDPVVLPGEDATSAFTPAATGGTDRGDVLEVDASADIADLDGEITASSIRGLGMADGSFTIGVGPGSLTVTNVLSFVDLEFASVTTGPGADGVTVASTHAGNDTCDEFGCPLNLITGSGDDSVDVQSISGQTVVDLGGDDDTATVGQPEVPGQDVGDVLDDIDAGLTVVGGDGTDLIDLDDRAAVSATRVDIDPGLITEAGLAADGVTHSAVETVNIRLGPGSDTANVRGTTADATGGTHVFGNAGNDRFLVSSAATYGIATSEDHLGGDVDDVEGPLSVHGGSGDANQLMVSDREASTGDLGVTYDGVVLTGVAPATITHDVVGGAFGRGITIWTSQFADAASVTGTDLSTQAGIRTLTTLNTGDGDDDITVDLTDGTDGAFVVNGEEGDDIVDASTSSLDLIVFGGLGTDDLTTGSGNDIVIGDLATITTTDGGTITGGGGPGDRTDGGVQPIDRITSDPSGGDADTIATGAGTDIAFGGTGGDVISGGPDADLLIGGHSTGGAPDAADTIHGDGGEDLIAGDNAKLDLSGADDVLTLFDVETTSATAPAGSGAGDTLFGGGDNDAIYGQQGNDTIDGDGGDDEIEGNSGADTIAGGDGQDDVLGGGSALDGVLDDDRAWMNGTVSLADENDTIDGDGGDDVILGDNGWIVRTFQPDGSATTLADLFGEQNPTYDDMVVRDVQATTTVEPDGSFGADLIRGGDGSDEIHGQLDTTRVTIGGNTIAGDELLGGSGDDVIIGDLGSVANVLEDGSNETAITDNGPFLDAVLRTPGSLTREVTLFLQQDGDHVDTGDGSDAAQFGAEGDDFMLGGDGSDSIHGGAGDDVANGGGGVDVVFGGDGNDALWGGADDDELFGGHDEDSIDVVPRDFTTTTKGRNKVTLGPDPAIWFEAAPSADELAGLDVAYGGWNSDEMQADEKANGPKPGDRLVDWAGAYNRYLSCSNGGGAGTFLRGASPSIRAFVTDLAEGRGAVDASVAGSSGYRELGVVEIADITNNTGSVGGSDHVACP